MTLDGVELYHFMHIEINAAVSRTIFLSMIYSCQTASQNRGVQESTIEKSTTRLKMSHDREKHSAKKDDI